MATKLFVVCAYGWEYNDEYYYHNDGTTPRKAYKSKEKAQKDCDARNLHELTSNWAGDAQGVRDYVSEGLWENLVGPKNKEALFKLFNEYDVKVTDQKYVEIENSDEPLPPEFFVKLAALVDFVFYCVTEVEAELK